MGFVRSLLLAPTDVYVSEIEDCLEGEDRCNIQPQFRSLKPNQFSSQMTLFESNANTQSESTLRTQIPTRVLNNPTAHRRPEYSTAAMQVLQLVFAATLSSFGLASQALDEPESTLSDSGIQATHSTQVR